MSEFIEIFGQVKEVRDKAPLHMIKVAVFREDLYLTHEFTNEEGRYWLRDIPADAPITVLFDTHQTLNNADDWHPSAMVNVEATPGMQLNRHLMRVGMAYPDASVVDTLAAYQLCVVWYETQLPLTSDERREYARHAAIRLGQLKVPALLMDIHRQLAEFFREQGKSK